MAQISLPSLSALTSPASERKLGLTRAPGQLCLMEGNTCTAPATPHPTPPQNSLGLCLGSGIAGWLVLGCFFPTRLGSSGRAERRPRSFFTSLQMVGLRGHAGVVRVFIKLLHSLLGPWALRVKKTDRGFTFLESPVVSR